jgi:hypothetical protein
MVVAAPVRTLTVEKLDLDRLTNAIQNRLTVVAIHLGDADAPYLVFESLTRIIHETSSRKLGFRSESRTRTEQRSEAHYRCAAEDRQRAGALAGLHRDPFDRLLAAQGMRLGVPIVTNDPAGGAFGVTCLW